MKFKLSIFGILLVFILSESSCYYDKEELLYGTANGPCTDSTGVISYAQQIVPIFQQNCYGCHTGSFPSGGIVMGTYAADKVIAQNGKLYGSINHSSGFKAMPQGAPKMNICRITLVKKWIDSGILNN